MLKTHTSSRVDNYSRGLSSTIDEAQIVSVQKGWESIDEKNTISMFLFSLLNRYSSHLLMRKEIAP